MYQNLLYVLKAVAAFVRSYKTALLFIFFTLVISISMLRAQQVSRDINTYALFAYDELNFKGRSGLDLTRGTITGGHVGVNNTASGGASSILFTGPVNMPTNGSQVVGDNVNISGNSSIGELYANAVQAGFSTSCVRNETVQSFSGPVVSSLPSFPSITVGFLPVTIAADEDMILKPGKYADLTLNDNTTLTLLAGVYQFSKLIIGKDVTIITNDNTEVRVARTITIDKNCTVGPSNLTKFYVRSDGTSIDSNSVNFGHCSTFRGQVFAPNGKINLGQKTNLYGRFWSKKIDSDYNVNVTYQAPATDDGDPIKRQSIAIVNPENSAFKTALLTSFPNPCSISTNVRYSLSVAETVTIKVYNMSGIEVATLVNGKKEAGEHQVQWNPSVTRGGTYIIRFNAGGFTATDKLMIVK